MAVTVTALLTTIDDCEDPTGWSGGAANGTFREGANSLSAKVSNTTSTFDYTGAPLTGGQDMTGDVIYVWVNCLTADKLDTFAAAGIGIRVGDGVNTATYAVGGRDTYFGGWKRFAIDPATAPVFAGTRPDVSAVTLVGVHFDIITHVAGGDDNCLWDILHHGTGLRITGGTSGDRGTFQEIETDDQSTTNAFGIIENVGGVFFLKGELIFGDAAGSSDVYFEDSGQILVFENIPVAHDFYGLKVEGGTGTNHFQLGGVEGSEKAAIGLDGVVIKSVNLNRAAKLDFGDPDIDTLNLYNLNVVGGRNVTFSGSGSNIVDCTFSKTDTVKLDFPAAANILRNKVVSSTAISPRSVVADRDTGANDIDFNNNDPSLDTIVRNSGSFITDGFVSGQRIVVTGALLPANNGTYVLDTVAALTLTLTESNVLTDSLTNTGVIITAGNIEGAIQLFEPDTLDAVEFSVILGDGFSSADDETTETLELTNQLFDGGTSSTRNFVRVHNDKTWNIINPSWVVDESDRELNLNFTVDDLNKVNEKFSLDLTVQTPAGVAIAGATSYIFEGLNNINLPADNRQTTNISGAASSNILTKEYTWDGSSSDLTSDSFGSFALRVYKYTKTPFVGSLTVDKKLEIPVSLTVDTAITEADQDAARDSGSGVEVYRHETGELDPRPMKVIHFDGGTGTIPSVGHTISGTSSGSVAQTVEILGDATAGTLVTEQWNGTDFTNNETIDNSHSGGSWFALADTSGGGQSFQEEYTWQVAGSGVAMSIIYDYLAARLAEDPIVQNPTAGKPFEDVITWGADEQSQLIFSGPSGFFTNNTTISGGVWVSDRGGGTIDFFTSDGGTTFTPPATRTFELTGLQANSEVRIYQVSDGSEINGTESSSTTFQHTYIYTADTPIFVIIHHLSYKWLKLIGLTLENSNKSVPVQQIFDRDYDNPA